VVDIVIKFLGQTQRRCIARDDEISDENSDGVPKKHGHTTFLFSVDANEYLHHVARKCVVISIQLAFPHTFPLSR
jgi:hypothetical protein